MVWRASLVVACFNNSADTENFSKCKCIAIGNSKLRKALTKV